MPEATRSKPVSLADLTSAAAGADGDEVARGHRHVGGFDDFDGAVDGRFEDAVVARTVLAAVDTPVGRGAAFEDGDEAGIFVEAVVADDPETATEATGAFGNYPDVGGMEEVQINTAALSAEASTPGVQSQFISKSGGNQFRGTFFGGYSPEKWQSHNIDANQLARGLQGGGGIAATDVNRLSSYQDTNIGLGGYVKKDRLWWYGSYRHQDVKARFVNFPVKPQTTTDGV